MWQADVVPDQKEVAAERRVVKWLLSAAHKDQVWFLRFWFIAYVLVDIIPDWGIFL